MLRRLVALFGYRLYRWDDLLARYSQARVGHGDTEALDAFATRVLGLHL